MKILSAEQIRKADAFTIANESIRSSELMERAAAACFGWIKSKYSVHRRFIVFCGTGNNGGDGLALSRMLFQNGYEVIPNIIRSGSSSSEDNHINEARLLQLDLSLVRNIFSVEDIGEIDKNDVIIDALYGTGLSRPLQGLAAEVVLYMNSSGAETVSIDIPSGLFSDQSSVTEKNYIVKATHTLTFQLMKLAFMFPENYTYTGNVTVLDIGLNASFIENEPGKYRITSKEDVRSIAERRNPFAHKGDFGHALLISGSSGKSGAAILAGRACLRAGAGLLTIHVPKSDFRVIHLALPEAMFSGDSDWDCFSDNIATDRFNALGIGCGIGTSAATANALKLLIQGYRYPAVFDADAINILAANPTWLDFIPENSIFTPHPKEFERLAGKSSNHFERNAMQIEFAVKYKVYLLLKGKYSAIACPDGTCYFNPTGNPGMATAGAGDVLTGIITGLLAQGFSPKESIIGGVYIHGLAGDLAATEGSQQSMIASDIIEHLGGAFKELT
jgi:hydroxyethylthiazole kinase-like uncharacterized protein yjeF